MTVGRPPLRRPAGHGLTIGDDRPVDTAWLAFFDDVAKRLNQVGWWTLSTTTVSTAAAADFTLPAGFSQFRFEIANLGVSVAGASLVFRASFDGTTFSAGATDYTYTSLFSTAPSTASAATGTTSYVDLTGPLEASAGLGRATVSATVSPGSSTNSCRVGVSGWVVTNTPEWRDIMVSGGSANGTRLAVRLLPTSGTFSANISMQGLPA